MQCLGLTLTYQCCHTMRWHRELEADEQTILYADCGGDCGH